MVSQFNYTRPSDRIRLTVAITFVYFSRFMIIVVIIIIITLLVLGGT